jgi:hypothetical protein
MKRLAKIFELNILINLIWIFWYLRNYKMIQNFCSILDTWNRNIPYFYYKFPNLNTKTFIEHYKYWVHWIRKMDPREKLVFNAFTPYILVNEEEWLHLDLSKNEIPVISYTYYFPDSQWLPIVIFKSIEQLQCYVSISEARSDDLITYIHTNIQSEKMSSDKNRLSEDFGGHRRIICDEDGISLAPEFHKN